MSQVQTQRFRSNYFTIRKGNRKARVSFWAEGHHLFLAVAMAMVLVAFALGFVWSNYQAVQTGYAISQRHQEAARLMDMNRKLKVELANLTALDRLERIATQNLGLVHPKPNQLVVVE